MRCSIEMTISYVYLSLHSYADRDNVGLPGFAAWFKEESDGERDHAQLLLNFQVRLACHQPGVFRCQTRRRWLTNVPSVLGSAIRHLSVILADEHMGVSDGLSASAEQARRQGQAAHAGGARDGVSVSPLAVLQCCQDAFIVHLPLQPSTRSQGAWACPGID